MDEDLDDGFPSPFDIARGHASLAVLVAVETANAHLLRTLARTRDAMDPDIKPRASRDDASTARPAATRRREPRPR